MSAFFLTHKNRKQPFLPSLLAFPLPPPLVHEMEQPLKRAHVVRQEQRQGQEDLHCDTDQDEVDDIMMSLAAEDAVDQQQQQAHQSHHQVVLRRRRGKRLSDHADSAANDSNSDSHIDDHNDDNDDDDNGDYDGQASTAHKAGADDGDDDVDDDDDLVDLVDDALLGVEQQEDAWPQNGHGEADASRHSDSCASSSPPLEHDELLRDLPPVVLEFLRGRGIKRLYPCQRECLQAALQYDHDHPNVLMTLPTSGGKTLVAEILALKTMLLQRKDAILVLPYVAIVQEKVAALEPLADRAGFHLETYAGHFGRVPPLQRRDGLRTLFVATIEKAHSLISSLLASQRLGRLGLCIVDEVHMLGYGSRGGILEINLALLLHHAGRSVRIVAMTATAGNTRELAVFLRARCVSNTSRPVVLREFVLYDGGVYDITGIDEREELCADLMTSNFVRKVGDQEGQQQQHQQHQQHQQQRGFQTARAVATAPSTSHPMSPRQATQQQPWNTSQSPMTPSQQQQKQQQQQHSPRAAAPRKKGWGHDVNNVIALMQESSPEKPCLVFNASRKACENLARSFARRSPPTRMSLCVRVCLCLCVCVCVCVCVRAKC